jgi:hypothetical protein
MLRLQPSFDGSVEASHPHVKEHGPLYGQEPSVDKVR